MVQGLPAATFTLDEDDGSLRSLKAALPGAARLDGAALGRALQLAREVHGEQEHHGGEGAMVRALGVAAIVDGLGMDHEAVMAALLHDALAHGRLPRQRLEKELGADVARLAEGVARMGAIPETPRPAGRQERDEAGVESLRRMLLAMVEDVRVVVVKLAERLQTLRAMKHWPAGERERLARETLEVFAPLANRLGIWQLKWELEDLALRYTEPAVYQRIAARLAERRSDREQYIADVIRRLDTALRAAGVHGEISGRPKHIYSIWRKMQTKGLAFENVLDVRGVRVLVDDVGQCYAALGAVHSLWSPIPGEFDDYIATPKKNNYQSIHTAVMGPGGRTLEVQIRTREMHEQNEFGVAAHWRYKENVRRDADVERKIAWLRQLLAWKDEVADATDLMDRFRDELFEQRVYVFTPRGAVIDLPAGATPVDFAYAVHTEVGHRCRGARVNGRIVPLTCRLHTGEQVEVLTVKKGGPSRDWLNPGLGYIRSSRTRAKVQRWFKEANFEHNVSTGRGVLERELHRLGAQDIAFAELASRLGFARTEEMLAAIGSGDLRPARVVSALPEHLQPAAPAPAAAPRRRRRRTAAADGGFSVEGAGGLLTQMAKCCNPLPGDNIIGYITRGRGVSVHRRDCANALQYGENHPERLVEVQWRAGSSTTFPVDIEVHAFDRTGLLRDITGVLADAGLNVVSVATDTDRGTNEAHMRLTVEVPDIQRLSQVLSRISGLGNVTRVRRVTG